MDNERTYLNVALGIEIAPIIYMASIGNINMSLERVHFFYFYCVWPLHLVSLKCLCSPPPHFPPTNPFTADPDWLGVLLSYRGETVASPFQTVAQKGVQRIVRWEYKFACGHTHTHAG